MRYQSRPPTKSSKLCRNQAISIKNPQKSRRGMFLTPPCKIPISSHNIVLYSNPPSPPRTKNMSGKKNEF